MKIKSGIRIAAGNGKPGWFVTKNPVGWIHPTASSAKKMAVIKAPPKPNPNQKSFHQAELILKPKSEKGRRSIKRPAIQTLREKRKPLIKNSANNLSGEELLRSPERVVSGASLNNKLPISERGTSLKTSRINNEVVCNIKRQAIRKRFSCLFQKIFLINSNIFPGYQFKLFLVRVKDSLMVFQDYSNSNTR